jgi:hypothetical protein
VVEELTEISQRLMRAIAASLGLEANAFDHCFHPWPNIQYKVARSLLRTWHSTVDEYILTKIDIMSLICSLLFYHRTLPPSIIKKKDTIFRLGRDETQKSNNGVLFGAHMAGICVPPGKMLPVALAPILIQACSLSLSRCVMQTSENISNNITRARACAQTLIRSKYTRVYMTHLI